MSDLQVGFGNVLTVDQVFGNDETATRSNGVAFQTLTAAKTAALSGDLIRVLPGLYDERDLFKDGVNWFFEQGAKVIFVDPGVSGGTGYGIFDDRSSGAVTCSIDGWGEFQITETVAFGTAGTEEFTGCIVISNPASNVTIRAKRVSCSSYNSVQNSFVLPTGNYYALFVNDCVKVVAEIAEITDPNFNVTTLDPADGVTILDSQGGGVLWGRGEFHLKVGRIISNGNSVWCEEPVGANSTNFWLTADHIESGIDTAFYANSHSANYRTWVIVKEGVSCSNGNRAGLLYGWAYVGSAPGGKHYLMAEKIVTATSGQTGMYINSGTVWLNIQKLSAFATNFGIYGQNGGEVHGTIEHIEDLLACTSALDFRGGCVAYLRVGYAKIHNGIGIYIVGGGSVNVEGLHLDTANTNHANNHCVRIESSGLVLRHCVLINPALANSLYAPTAQTITNYGSVSKATLGKHANVTVNVQAMLESANVV